MPYGNPSVLTIMLAIHLFAIKGSSLICTVNKFMEKSSLYGCRDISETKELHLVPLES